MVLKTFLLATQLTVILMVGTAYAEIQSDPTPRFQIKGHYELRDGAIIQFGIPDGEVLPIKSSAKGSLGLAAEVLRGDDPREVQFTLYQQSHPGGVEFDPPFLSRSFKLFPGESLSLLSSPDVAAITLDFVDIDPAGLPVRRCASHHRCESMDGSLSSLDIERSKLADLRQPRKDLNPTSRCSSKNSFVQNVGGTWSGGKCSGAPRDC